VSGKLSRVWITQEWPCPPLGACELLFAWLLTLLLPLELLLTLTLGTCAEPPPSTEGEDGELDAGTCRGGGASSLRGGMRSLMASRPLASSNEVILWVGEKPWRAFRRVSLPPDRAPSGKEPVGVRPLSWSTLSLSSLQVNVEILRNWKMVMNW